MRSVRFLFVTACTVYAYNLLPHAYSLRLELVPACTVLYTLTKHKISGVFFIVHGAFASNLIPHTGRVCLQFAKAYVQGRLTIRYCMRRICLQFATACLEYVNKANDTQILPFQLNQVKTYEKSKNQKKLFVTHSSGPQGNQNNFFLC
jgi:hypothetical protein